MQEQQTPPANPPSKKTPLEEQGHLTRTQLYILLAILSVAVLGLCGYIVWDLYQTEEATTSTTVTEDEEVEEDQEESTQNTIKETKEEDLTESATFSCAGYVDGNLVSDQWSFSVEYPTDVVIEEVDADCKSLRFYYGESFLHLSLGVGGHTTQLEDDYLTANEEYGIVRDPNPPSDTFSLEGNSYYRHQYFHQLEDDVCDNAGEIYPGLHSPCGGDGVFENHQIVYLNMYLTASISEDEKAEAYSVFDEIVGSIELL